MSNPTEQDIKVLREFVYNCLRNEVDSNLFYKALKKLNWIEGNTGWKVEHRPKHFRENCKGEVNLFAIVSLIYLGFMLVVLLAIF